MKRLIAGWSSWLLVAVAGGGALASHAQDGRAPEADGPKALMDAARLGRVETVRRLLEVGLDPDTADASWQSYWGGRFTAVTWAVARGHRDVLEVLLKAGASADATCFYPRSKSTTTVLHLAVYYRRLDLARLLLDHGARVNGRRGWTEWGRDFRVIELDEQGNEIERDPLPRDFEHDPTPLHLAAAVGELECVHMLIDAGADLESLHKGASPLLLAAMCEQEEAAESLLHAGAVLDLHSSIALGRIEAAGAFLERDPGLVDSCDARLHRTPLHWAARFNRTRMVALLLELGADVHALAPQEIFLNAPGGPETSRGWLQPGREACTPLHLAARHGHWGAVLGLLRAGADLDALDSDNETPLVLAIEAGHRDLALWLLERGADPNLPAEGDRALHAAAYENDPVLARRLVEAGAELEYCGGLGETPLELAGLWEHVEVAEVLREAGGEVDLLTACVLDERAAGRGWRLEPPSRVESFLGRFTKWRAIEVAASMGHLDLLQELIARGARLEPAEGQQTTVIHEAAAQGQLHVLRWALERDIDPDLLSERGGATPLQLAAREGQLDAARLLLERGAELDARSSYGGTALREAVVAGEVEMVRFLLERGAELSVPGGVGRTPLHVAAYQGDPVIARLLLDAGADASVQDRDGWTPLGLAEGPVEGDSGYSRPIPPEGRRAVVEILRRHAERR